jgi:hypothetical protein
MLAYSARHNCGGGCAAKPVPPPLPKPNSAARLRPPSDPTARWAARSRAAPASAPLDGDDGTPGWGRLCPPSGGVDHWPCSRPPRLSTTGIVRGGGEGGATPGGGGGNKDGALAGVGRRCNVPLPRILVTVQQFLQRGRGSYIGNNGRGTKNNQKLTKGAFL